MEYLVTAFAGTGFLAQEMVSERTPVEHLIGLCQTDSLGCSLMDF